MWGFKICLHSILRQIRLPAPFTRSWCEEQNGHNKAPFPGRLAKSILEEKEVEKIVGDEDKQDNALNASTFLFSLCQLRYALCSIRYASI